MKTRRPARQARRMAAASLVLLVTSLGFFAALALAPTPADARSAVRAESTADDPTAGPALPEPDLPRTTTGNDGFVVLGAALAATTVVALLMALRNRSLSRQSRRPAGWARATGRAARSPGSGPGASPRIAPRSRYSSRSRR